MCFKQCLLWEKNWSLTVDRTERVKISRILGINLEVEDMTTRAAARTAVIKNWERTARSLFTNTISNCVIFLACKVSASKREARSQWSLKNTLCWVWMLGLSAPIVSPSVEQGKRATFAPFLIFPSIYGINDVWRRDATHTLNPLLRWERQLITSDASGNLAWFIAHCGAPCLQECSWRSRVRGGVLQRCSSW